MSELRASIRTPFWKGLIAILFFFIVISSISLFTKKFTYGVIIGKRETRSLLNGPSFRPHDLSPGTKVQFVKENNDTILFTEEGEYGKVGEVVKVAYSRADPSNALVFSFRSFWMKDLIYLCIVIGIWWCAATTLLKK